MRYSCFCGRFLLPMLLIFLQIPIQIDLVDSGRDRIAKQVLFIGLSFAYSLPCRCYAKGRAKHIFELVAEIVIGSLKRIAVLLYAKHHPKPIKRNDRLDHGNKEQARKVLPENSALWQSLDGQWQFHWAKNPDERPKDFYKTDFDASAWDKIQVPMSWNMAGKQANGTFKYGEPLYSNQRVIFQHQVRQGDWKGGVMRTPSKDWMTYKNRNEVGSYRRTFTLPAAWDGMFPRVQCGHKEDYTIKGLRFVGGHGTQMDGYSQAYLSGAEQARFTVEPTYSVTIAHDVMDENGVADAILKNSGDQISEGTALYLDG